MVNFSNFKTQALTDPKCGVFEKKRKEKKFEIQNAVLYTKKYHKRKYQI